MRRSEALNEQLYDKLKEAILSDQFEFNTFYSETKLAAQYSVSRTPIRDALVRLSQEHFLDIIPSRGFMLHKPDEHDLNAARHFRLAMESYCARLIALEPDETRNQVIKELESIWERQRQCADPEHRKLFWQLDMQFHYSIVSRLRNPYFDNSFQSSFYLFSSLAVETFFHQNRHISTLNEHAAIIAALKAADIEASNTSVQFHIEESINAILSKQ